MNRPRALRRADSRPHLAESRREACARTADRRTLPCLPTRATVRPEWSRGGDRASRECAGNVSIAVHPRDPSPGPTRRSSSTARRSVRPPRAAPRRRSPETSRRPWPGGARSAPSSDARRARAAPPRLRYHRSTCHPRPCSRRRASGCSWRPHRTRQGSSPSRPARSRSTTSG